MKLNRILVATDFSENSLEAVPIATWLGKEHGAEIIVAHVVPETIPPDLAYIGQALEARWLYDRAKDQMKPFIQEHFSGLAVESLVETGSPAYTLSRLAETRECDLIVIATHGHTGLQHMLLGSTAEALVRAARTPVLVARKGWTPAPARGQEKEILMPVDFSELSGLAATYAAEWKEQFGGNLRALHVVEPPPYPEFGYAHVPIKEAERRRAALKKMTELLGDLENKAHEIRYGSAAAEIVQAARERGASLIIIPTHGRHGIRHIFGSVAERVIRHAPCSVLALPARALKAESPAKEAPEIAAEPLLSTDRIR